MNNVICETIKKVSAEYNVPEELLEEFYNIRDKKREINLNIEKTAAARAEIRDLSEELNQLEEKFKKYDLKFVYTSSRDDITDIPVLYKPSTETRVIDIPSNEEINERAREIALENNFPELTGTPKQVTWANSIRVGFWEKCHKNGKEKIGDYLVYGIHDSKYWIENKEITENSNIRCIKGMHNSYVRLAREEHYIKD